MQVLSADDTAIMGCFAATEGGSVYRIHEDHIAASGYASEDYWAMVHTPIPIPRALTMPRAREALDKEWNKLRGKAWREEDVRERDDVEREANLKGLEVHFATLMDLCHEKHSELEEHLRIYKGRVVVRGDLVKDETGYFAVFSEQVPHV